MKKRNIPLFMIIILFCIISVTSFSQDAKTTNHHEIQKLIVGKWAWHGEIPNKTLRIVFEFFSDGSLGIRRKQENEGSILFPPTAIKKILQGTMAPSKFSYEIREKTIKVYFPNSEEITGEVISISPTILKISMSIGDSTFLLVLQRKE